MTREVRRQAAVGGVLLALVVGVVAWFWHQNAREDRETATAVAVMNHRPDEAWPPAAGDLENELAATASRAVDGGARDAALDSAIDDAGPVDGGPAIVLPDELDGLLVRRGQFEDIAYIEVVIGAESFEDALPVVFIFHGRGGSAQLPGGPFRRLSHPVRMIVPQAPERLGTGWAWLPVSVGSGLVDRLASSLFQLGSRMAQMIREVSGERATVGRPIVTGFSQGGLVVYALALHHDDVVSHAFPLSTWLPPPLEPLYRRPDLHYPPIRSMHGTDDPVIPVAPTRELAARLVERGFDVEFEEFAGVGHAMNDEMNVVFHRWLERAVCDEVGDDVCPAAIEPGADAGVVLEDAGLDASIDDAGLDGGRRRRARRDTGEERAP